MSQKETSRVLRPLLYLYPIGFVAYCWLFSPTLNPMYQGGLVFWTMAIAAGILASVPVHIESSRYGSNSSVQWGSRVAFAVAIGLAAIGLTFLTSSPMLHADAYFQLLGEEHPADFNASLPPMDLAQAPLVSSDMAHRAAEKKLSEVPALGSQVKLGRMTKQLVRGKLYWVAFLHHRGFFKWWSEGSTPGYVMVSANDSADVALVTEVDGKPLKMKYLSSAFFGQDLDRHLWLKGYAFTGLTDYTPEIDEQGHPFYVATRFAPKVGFGGQDATGVVVLDVQTGETTEYSGAQVPAWIDRVQPEALIASQVESRLTYMHGWWNPSDKDRQAISGEIDLVYGTNGKAYYFVGITSTGREGGLTGFMLIDTHTKEVKRFSLSGVTEQVAQHAAEGVMPEKRYSATNALPFIVHGVPSYVMALRDNTGLARAYAIVNMQSFNVVATGETLQAATRLYQQKLSMDRTQSDAQTTVEVVKEDLVVRRIGAEVRSGNTVYFLTVEGNAEVMLMGNSELSEKLVITHPGDTIRVEYKKGAGPVAPMTHFDNLAIGK